MGICACIGRMGNDPMCPCAMRTAGLVPSRAVRVTYFDPDAWPRFIKIYAEKHRQQHKLKARGKNWRAVK